MEEYGLQRGVSSVDNVFDIRNCRFNLQRVATKRLWPSSFYWPVDGAVDEAHWIVPDQRVEEYADSSSGFSIFETANTKTRTRSGESERVLRVTASRANSCSSFHLE